MRSEIGEVLAAIERLRERGERSALATVVAVRGSTYRGPGARVLVAEGGDLTGTISGGCLEGDVADVARVVMEDEEPRLVDFDLTADDEAVWGWGLGCNGALEVFVEPVEESLGLLEPLRQALEEDRPVALATVVESGVDGVEPGARLLVHPDGRVEGDVGRPEVDEVLTVAGRDALERGRSTTERLSTAGGDVRAFVEVLEPASRLLVCGAGHDAIPLVRIAASLGWRPFVVDDREDLLTPDRFPHAAGFVPVGRPEEAARAAGVDPRTSVVIMSHNYLRDLGYLRSFLGSGAAYLGCLGPRTRLERLLGDLEREGIVPSEEDRAALRGPAGLDLGADGPDEIALAIVSEILASRSGRDGGPLRARGGPIHEREGAG
ncbi:MAG TPA: XdhC family protein [Actinomycetota bacterium]